eukprot:68934_1
MVGKLLLCILNTSFKLSNNHQKWNKHLISLHKDYLISLIFEKMILIDQHNSIKHINKDHFELVRFFSGATHIALSYSQMLNENFTRQLNPCSIFSDCFDIQTIDDSVQKWNCGKLNDVLYYMRKYGYHNNENNANLCFNAVQSVNYFNELIGFRRDVNDNVYPFNSVFINSGLLTLSSNERLLIGYDTTFDLFDFVNEELNKNKCTYDVNLKSFVYGINLWQYVAKRYKIC